jgi:GTP pyrophosphokinase
MNSGENGPQGPGPNGSQSPVAESPQGAESPVSRQGSILRSDRLTMDKAAMLRLKRMHLAPYIQLATCLIGKLRRSGGNMFRHQLDTMTILMDYGYIDSVLLKASLIHDLLEDAPKTDPDTILSIDDESVDVYKLVLEVTRRPVENKAEFLNRIRDFGSLRAKVLKSADRISNMISLGYVTDDVFVSRYTDETEQFVFPIAERADERMLSELKALVATRRKYLRNRIEG